MVDLERNNRCCCCRQRFRQRPALVNLLWNVHTGCLSEQATSGERAASSDAQHGPLLVESGPLLPQRYLPLRLESKNASTFPFWLVWQLGKKTVQKKKVSRVGFSVGIGGRRLFHSRRRRRQNLPHKILTDPLSPATGWGRHGTKLPCPIVCHTASGVKADCGLTSASPTAYEAVVVLE